MPLNSQKEAYFRELKDICQSKNIWQNADDRIFCKCGVGVLGIDLANQTTTRCADCGFIMTLQGERIA